MEKFSANMTSAPGVEKAKKKLQDTGVKEAQNLSAKKALSEASKKLPGPTNYQNTMIKGSKAIMGGAALFIGATSIIDASVTANRNKKARKEVDRRNKKEEENMKRDKRYRKKQRRRDSRNSIHVGQTVMDMFDQRIGHHKMGGSKNFPA